MADIHQFPHRQSEDRSQSASKVDAPVVASSPATTPAFDGQVSDFAGSAVDGEQPKQETILQQAEIQAKLQSARNKHRDLDARIEDLKHAGSINRMALQRLKKEKLLLRDLIREMQGKLLPDIIA